MESVRDLYESDFFAWTRHQARELKRLKGLHLNTELDLSHLVEEVRDLGGDQRDACRGQVERVLEQLLKLRNSPAEQLPRLYVHARRAAAFGLEEHGEFAAAKRLPEACPFTLDDILRADWYPEPLIAGG